MAFRPPRPLAQRALLPNPLASLEHEMLQEATSSLADQGRRVTSALAALAAFDDQTGEAAERLRLVGTAGEAVWAYVVQREAMGLRNTEAVLRELKVPAAVRLRMGPRRGS